MKLRGDNSSSRSCSCTSCFYKSESEDPSIRRMLAKGSRIDKLFIGKYLPLREEKLLNRLVRTRAIYNDIRSQLLSDSNVNESDKGDLKPVKQMPIKREGKRKDKELSDAERSSALLRLVNLVDKGATLGPHKLSECCSCCVCGPKANKNDISRPQRHRHRHASSRSSFTSGMRTRDDRHGHRARNIRSDPCNCTCANEDCDLNIRKTRAVSKESVTDKKVGGRQKIKRHRQGMGEAFGRSITKFKKTKSQMSAKFRSNIKKSMETIKATEQSVQSKIRKHTKRYKHSEHLYSLRGGKRRKKTKDELELEVEEAIAKIKKDSLTKIREDMKKKKFNEDWACDFECDPEECEPEECLKIKMQNKRQTGEKKVHYKERNVGNITRVVSKTRMSQTKKPETTKKPESKEQETVPVDLKKNTKSEEPQLKSKIKYEQTNQPKKNNKSEFVCDCKTTSSRTEKPITELLPTATKTSTSETQKHVKPKASYVIQQSKRNARSGGYALKRCFCTLKLKSKGMKPKRPRSSDSKGVQTKTSKTLSTSASTLLPYECEPNVCVPGQCDPMECIKRIKQRKARTTKTNTRVLKHRTKSTSSLMSKSSGRSVQVRGSENVEKIGSSKQLIIKRKDDVEPTSNKQAVRISSSFSFNIEFYKETPSTQKNVASETETQSQLIQTQKRHKKVGKHKRLTHKPSQMTSTAKSKNTLTKHNLRRCFCTLKLAKKNVHVVQCECAPPKTVAYSKGTFTSGQSFTDNSLLRSTGTEKKLKRPKFAKYQLLPYECEPGICVPGKCDPYQCLQLIKKRNVKQRGSGTENRKKRSTYSVTEKGGVRAKTKKVQSVSATHKEDRLLVIPKRKVVSSPTRQAVKMGSSFSFDIEIYKGQPKDTQQDIEIVKEPSSSIKVKARGSQQKYGRKHRKSTSMESNTKEKGIFVGSDVKRCFCTFKLQKKAKKTQQNKTVVSSTTGTETIPVKDTIHPDMITRSTHIKKKRNRQLELLPYECEPGICIPGECDPYQCLGRIKKRNKKAKGFDTPTNKNKSAASTASSFNSRNALAQANLGGSRKKRKRSKHTTSSSYPKVPIPVVSKSSHQALRIGSNLSFNIEFAKVRSNELPNESLIKKPDRKIRVKDKGSDSNNTKLIHSDAQSTTVKTINQGSRIKPILKRCFCTLKLAKKDVQNKKVKPPTKPVVAIVMPVQVQNKSFALSQYKTNIPKSYIQHLPPKATKSNAMNWFNKNTISSLSYEFPFNMNKSLTKEERSSRSVGKILSKEENRTTESYLRRTQLIGVSQYLKKSFYALNLHVQNHEKKMHKLLPHECEPGVCVPGECNPLECLKLINKRLMKRASTMTTTGNRSQSTSSGGTRVRTSQQQFGKTRQERADTGRDRVVRAPKAIKYESPPTQTHKQAVRVGSTFSFDIEFFKDKSARGNKNIPQVKKRMNHNVGGKAARRNHKGTRGSQVLRRDRHSQSSIMMHDKGQNITRPKRCFCTLKLQKMGKQHVQVGHEAKPQVQYINAGQNTKNRGYNLDPNECEPGVCIPGQCDPYECLERIKRRHKNVGSGMSPGMMSSSSMTKQTKERNRGKHVQIKEKRLKPGRSTVSTLSRPKTSAHGSRQAVRIGSNFSFNVEFYKDRSHGRGAILPTPSAAPAKIKTRTKDYNQNTKMTQPQSSMGRSSQDSTALRHQNIQHGPNTKAVETKTGAFLKRCFCTLKLLKTKQKETPKFITGVKKTPKPAAVITGVSSQTNGNQEKKMKLPKVEPYECEPGVCVPGECNPTVCLQRINRRNRLNKMSSTESAESRSLSTSFRPPRSNRSAGSDARAHTKKTIDQKPKYSQHVSTPVVKPVTVTSSLDRNVVRIGSNFSFNVEFYKDRISPKYQNVQKAAKEVKTKHLKSTASTKARRKAKNRGVNKYGQYHSRDYLADFIPKHDRGTGMLKRCFCTLALHKQAGKDKVLMLKEQGTASPHYKTYPTVDDKNTITKKLEPYECEPGVCIPGECDPYECLKLIQRRREQGTSTPKHRTSSSATLMRQQRKLKDQHAQHHAKVPHQQRTRPSRAPRPSQQVHSGDKRQHRQAVKIGSNFSFNIEFSKNKTGGDQVVKIKKEPRADRYDTRSTSSKPERSKPTRNTTSQGKSRVRDSDSQVIGNNVRSTVTETTPFLKRCFCTLMFKTVDKNLQSQYKKAEVIKPTIPKHTQHHDVGISTPKKNTFKNLPYECDPGFCVPGQCDPYDCLKRIEKINMQTKMAYTDRPRGRRISTVTSETKTSSKAFQNNTNIKPKRTYGHAREGRVTSVNQKLVTNSANNKQAVRIGSSFSFDVKFSKNKTNKIPFHTDAPTVYPTLVSTKNNAIDPGIKKFKTAMSSSDRKLMNRRTQSARKTASTGSGVGPLLKRCFCTLKLQKIGRLQRQSRLKTTSKPMKSTNKILDSPSIKYKDKGIGPKKRFLDLLPYECEPNICVPGECDPYKCLERIKMRNMCDSAINCKNRNTNSVSSMAGRQSQIRKLQTLSDGSGVKSVATRSRDKKKNVNLTETNNCNDDRQAVYVGSNFSINIEFYKEHTPRNLKNVTFDTLPKINRSYNTKGEKMAKTNNRGSFDRGRSMHHKELQAEVGKEQKASGFKPLLQRCFCTLKLLEGNKQHKPLGPNVQVGHEAKPALQYTNTGQNTNKRRYRLPDLDANECEPGICIPGECDPYECLKRIKRRNIRHMATGISHGRRCSQASLTLFSPISKSKRTQYSPKQNFNGAKISNIVEQPRFPFLEPEYYQGLKIGSNVSVNIEFYKENALPNNAIVKEIVSRESKNMAQDQYNHTINKPEFNKGSSMRPNTCTKSRNCMQQADVQTEEKSSFIGNALKRCFCTSKLVGRNNVTTVGRVDKCITNSPFQPRKLQIYQMHWAKEKNGTCNPNCKILKANTQNATTRINEKYFSGDLPNFDPKNNKRNKNSDEMKTILPYAPKKFNKNESKTLVMRKSKSTKKYCCAYCKKTGSCNKDDGPSTKGAKRLTQKQEKTLITNKITLKRFMCNCFHILKIKNKTDGKTECKVPQSIMLKNVKNVKMEDSDNNYTEATTNLKVTKSERKPGNKNQKNKIKKSKSFNAKNAKFTVYVTSPFVCSDCQAKFDKGDFKKTIKSTKPCFKGKDFDNKSNISEFKKAGGDVKTLKKPQKKSEQTAQEKKPQNKDEIQSKGPCCVCTSRIELDTKNNGLKLTKSPPKQTRKLSTQSKKETSKESSNRTQNTKETSKETSHKAQDKKQLGKTGKPCICGSSVCAKTAKKEQSVKTKEIEQKLRKKGKPCVCGSPVCAKEAKKMHGKEGTKGLKDDKKIKKDNKKTKTKKINNDTCTCDFECQCVDPSIKEKKLNKLKANKKRKADIKNRVIAARQKIYAKEDAIRKKKRRAEDIKMYKQVLKTKNAGDCALLSESLLDIAKLGCTTAKDVCRSTFRTIMDPKNTAQNIKSCVRDPQRGLTTLKDNIHDSGVGSTCKRVGLRFTMMSWFKKYYVQLETCALTNFLIHINDKDPKKRMKPKKPKRKRPEPTDFECSPFMASLRKRPWLSVYYACPWFYPHCISMLQIWKQFTDIVLFLLAVVVWSPCILCMEFCRAFMCCFMCTG